MALDTGPGAGCVLRTLLFVTVVVVGSRLPAAIKGVDCSAVKLGVEVGFVEARKVPSDRLAMIAGESVIVERVELVPVRNPNTPPATEVLVDIVEADVRKSELVLKD